MNHIMLGVSLNTNHKFHAVYVNYLRNMDNDISHEQKYIKI